MLQDEILVGPGCMDTLRLHSAADHGGLPHWQQHCGSGAPPQIAQNGEAPIAQNPRPSSICPVSRMVLVEALVTNVASITLAMGPS